MRNYTRPDKALQKIGIQPTDVADIIITHPHFDHIGGIDLFSNAMLWMQQDDFDYFVGAAWQKNGSGYGFNKNDIPKLVQKNLDSHLKLLKGDSIEIIGGISVFIGFRHTYESQYVLVNGTSGKMKRIKTLVSDRDLIIPGHNATVFTKFPKVTEGICQCNTIAKYYKQIIRFPALYSAIIN